MNLPPVRGAMGRLAAVALVGLLVGCASDDGQAVEAGGAAAPASSPAADEGPATVALPVRNVELGDDDQHLELYLGELPAADAAAPCAYELHPDVAEDDVAIVRLNVTITVGHPYDLAFPSCATEPVWVTATLAAPLGERAVVGTDTIGQLHRWQAVDGALEACQLPGCDPATGQPPQPATCDNSSLIDAVRAGDVPRRAGITVLGCEGGWAVVDVDVGAGSCPAQEGPNPCAGVTVDRLFWHVDDGQWTRVFWSRDPGCGGVEPAVPNFPAHLCAGLPAPPVPPTAPS